MSYKRIIDFAEITSLPAGWMLPVDNAAVGVRRFDGSKLLVSDGSYSNPAWVTSLAWTKVTGVPTTLASMGMTDPVVVTSGSYADPSWVTSLAWTKVTGAPTTLTGLGITDAVVNTGSYANPAWVTALAWSKITSTPTTLAGYGVTDPVVLTSGSYSNPAWMTALAWSKLSGTPTTLTGYGVTDPVVLTSGSYWNPAWMTALAWSKITSTPTSLSGYGILDPVVLTTGSYANPAWLGTLAWSKIITPPTTLSGYGVTDPVVLTSGSYSNPSWVTALAGSKLTGAYTAAGATMATARILGRTTAGSGAAEEISIGTGLSLSAGVLSSTSSGGGTWGSITGTLSSQTDLNSALGAKAALAGATFTGAISATNLSGTNTGDQTLPTRSSLGIATSDSPVFAGLTINGPIGSTGTVSSTSGLTLDKSGLSSDANVQIKADSGSWANINYYTGTTVQWRVGRGSGGGAGYGGTSFIFWDEANSVERLKLTSAGATVVGTLDATNLSGTNTGDNATNSLYSGLAASKENSIAAGTTAQYYRGDKSWQTLNGSAVGLGSVENTALSTWAGSASITTLGTIASGTVPVARISGLGSLATQSGTFSGTSSGTNTGDQSLPTRATLGLATTDSVTFGPLTVNAASAISRTPDTASVLQLKGSSTNAISVVLETEGAAGNLVFRRAEVGAAAVPTNTNLGILGWRGAYTTNTFSGSQARIAAYTTENWNAGGTTLGTMMEFAVTPTGTSSLATVLALTGAGATVTGTFAATNFSGSHSGTSSGTNTGDNATNSLYSGLVTNATHTGDVTGSGALTLVTAQPAVHTWALAQTFTTAPVFTDAGGTRTALGLGSLATQSGTFSGTSSGTNTGDQTLPTLSSLGGLPLAGGTMTGAIMGNNGTTGFQMVKPSRFGYSAAYGTTIVGAASGLNTVCINVDPSANASGAFSGDGSEVMFRNVGSFITPNAANTGYGMLFSWSSAAAVTFANAISASNFSGSYSGTSSGTNTGDQSLSGLGGMPIGGGTMTGSLTINGDLTVGNSTNSNIYMTDTDEGTRRIHCNSNNIGFLNQAAGWGAYCNDNGDWISTGYIQGTNITSGGNVTGSSASCTGNAATSSSCSGNTAGTASSISGYNNPTTAATANTIAYRDASGHLIFNYGFANYYNSVDDVSAGTVSHIMCKFGDNYFRSGTAAKVAAFLSGATMNIAGSSTSCSGASASCSGNAATATTATNLSGGTVAATTITATGNITAYYSDDRLKTRLGRIENALAKVLTLDGFYYEANALAQSLGYKAVREVGLSAQQVNRVLPEVVAPAPVDPQYMTLHYERIIALLVEAMKELNAKIDAK